MNSLYEDQNLLSLQLVSFLVGLRTYQDPLYYNPYNCVKIAYSIQYSNMLYKFVA